MRALVAGLVFAGLTASTLLASPPRGRGDAYILAVGDRWTSGGIDVDELGGMRDKLPGDFLWFRRAGTAYRIDDPAILGKAVHCFDPLRALEPEQEALREKEERLDAKEEALDREQEEIEQYLEDDDADEEAGIAVDASERGELERRRDALEPSRRELRAEQRELASVERELDAREEALEAAAEAALWRLIGESVAGGAAKKAPAR
jgi:hypothetical protein